MLQGTLGWKQAERGLRLHDLASVSVSMLSSVERAEKAATIVVLGRIARGLGVPLVHLVADAAPFSPPWCRE